MTDATMSRAWRNVWVLFLAQAVLGSQIAMIFTIGSLIGKGLAPSVCWSTLPITMIILGSTTSAPWLSNMMQRHGRRVGFWIGAAGGLLGSLIAVIALYQGNFWLFLVGSYFTGVYQSSQGFFRFAATDAAPDEFKSKAISYVLAGGLVSALIGPQLVKATQDMTAVPFLASYMVAMAVNLFGMVLFFWLDLPKGPDAETHDGPSRSRMELLRDPTIAVAIICGAVSYVLMNLVMTATPLAVVGCGYGTGSASDVVSAHVVAMFLPSFFTGHLIARFGVQRIVAAGLFILMAAGIVGLMGIQLSNFFGALILLGIGWNFGFIGATTMLVGATQPSERGLAQGMNDMIVFGGVMLGSLASGSLMNCSGGSVEQGWSMVNLAMIPLLTLAAGALVWLWQRENRA